MRVLLDTHIALWWQTGDVRLRRRANALVASAESVVVSQASLWEIAIKVSVGMLPVDLPGFVALVPRYGFGWLEISNDHLLRMADLPVSSDHKDPFDRLLIAQAQAESATFVTADRRLTRYGDFVRLV